MVVHTERGDHYWCYYYLYRDDGMCFKGRAINIDFGFNLLSYFSCLLQLAIFPFHPSLTSSYFNIIILTLTWGTSTTSYPLALPSFAHVLSFLPLFKLPSGSPPLFFHRRRCISVNKTLPFSYIATMTHTSPTTFAVWSVLSTAVRLFQLSSSPLSIRR